MNRLPARIWSVLTAAFLGLLLLTMILTPATAAPATPQAAELTAVYVLAFDNDPAGSVDLGRRYTQTVAGLVQATSNPDVHKQAVILADLGSPADTHVLIAAGGIVTELVGLPDANGVWDPDRNEYNTASGTDLGGFLVWALTEYPARSRMLSYVGHGMPLAPETDISAVLDLADTGNLPDPNPNDVLLPPLPIHVDVNPAVTDFTSGDLISPYDLAQALRQTAEAGLPPIDVFDLVHCFSGTIEELYEIAAVNSPTGGPQATTLVGSPNYTFFEPVMLGKGLSAVVPGSGAANMAEQLVGTYDQHILAFDQTDNTADINHPRFLVAVESRHVVAIKTAWDEVAYHLLLDFDTAVTQLTAVYESETVDKYDTTYCAPLDYQLGVPDALVDLTRLARELATRYDIGHPVTVASVQTIQAVDTAVITSTFRNGEPWFAGTPKPVWAFDEAAGIAIYADLAGMALAGNDTPTLLWQSHWYTDTVFGGTAGNEQPYRFVQGGYDGQNWQADGSAVNWADVLNRWWRESLFGVQEPLATAACIPSFPPVLTDRVVLPAVVAD